jgi:hypothetical protein
MRIRNRTDNVYLNAAQGAENLAAAC